MSEREALLPAPDPILWRVDAWREEDGLWTAEVWAIGYGFGRSAFQKSWRTAIDKALTAASNEAADE